MQDDMETGDLRSLSEGEWLAHLERIGGQEGYFEPLGSNHAALFRDGAATLLVSFETVDSIRRARPEQMPIGYLTARANGWSSLTLIARTNSWYRDFRIYRYFDRLVDDAFFEDFDRVVFYGAGMAGYAAAAYSVTAPGATVIAIQPQATLDPRLAGWDPRWPEKRRLSFTDRYGFAPDMTEGAGEVYVIFDPEQALDAMHAALFARPWTHLLPCPNLGRDIATALDQMRMLPAILKAAGSGAFDPALFRTFYRARRNHPPYLRNLMGRLDAEDRPGLNLLLCRNVSNRLRIARFTQRIPELEEQLRAAGRRIPPLPTRPPSST
ncbi:MAG: phosphoadenosine phosphosulfate reductase [Pseudomonadota bacterium]